MAVNWNDFTPIEPQKAKSKAVDWSQFEPITEPTAEERANVRRGLNPDGTRLLPGAGSERTQARLQADSRPVTDEMVPTEVLEPRGAGTYIADRLVASGKTSLKGLGGLVKQANVDYGTGLGAADLAVGVGANILGRLGSDSAKELSNKLNAQAKPISDYGTSVADTLDSYVQDAEDYASPQEKAGDRALSEAKGVLGKLAYVAKNPSVIPEQFLNSIGYMAAGAGAGGAAAGLGAGAAVGANLGTQALLSASSSADGARDIIDQLPDEEIAQFPEYQELLNEYDAPTARKILRQRAGDQSFATGIIANAALFGLTAKLPTLERIMHGETGSSASRSINAMRTLLGEAGQEGLQGGAEQFATNVGTSSADNRVGLLDDVPEAAFMEAITTAPAAVTAGAVQPVAQRRKAEELKALREVAETPEQVGTLDAGIALAEARAGQAEKKGYYAQKRAENAAKAAEVQNVATTSGSGILDANAGVDSAESPEETGAPPGSVLPRDVGDNAGQRGSVLRDPAGPVGRGISAGVLKPTGIETPAQTQDAIDEAELDRLLTGAFPDSVEQDVSQTDVDGQDVPILASRNDEDVPDANGIEAEELSDAEAERQWIEATEGESDTLTEGMRALAKNPGLFQTPLYKGQSASDIVSNMPEGFSYGGSEVSNDSMTGESALATKVDVTQRFTNDDGSERVEVHPAYIYESPTRTWIEISELKPGGGGADQVYSAAHSLALNTGKKFKEDPDGLSEMAIIARPKHEASGIMKADSSRAIETGPFLARDSSQFGGTKNRPIALNPNPRVNDDLRERLLTIQANATLAVPEVKGIRYDVDSNQFRRGDGSVVTDSDFRGLARTRRANPVREAMVRDRKNPEDKYASPIGHDSLKVAALIETLRTTTDPGARSDLVAKLRVLAETSTDLGILSGILPSRKTEDGLASRQADSRRNNGDGGTSGVQLESDNRGNGRGVAVDAIRDNLTKRYGRRVKRLLDSGRTKIVQSRSEIPANIQAQLKAVDSVGLGTVQAFYHSATDTTYIIADSLKSLDEAGPLLIHEIVHARMKEKLGDKFPSIVRRLKSIAKSGTEAEKSIVQKAQKRVDRAGTPEQHADEELVAYTVQLAEAQALPSGRLKQWLEDVYAAIKLWAANKGLVNLSVNDIRLIARGALGHRGRLDVKDGKSAPLESRVFHGSPHRFDKFTTEKMGSGEGAQAYGWGLYFTDKKEIADYYRGGLSKANEKSDAAKPAAIDALKRNGLLGFDTVGEALNAIRMHSDYATRFDVEPNDVPAMEAYNNAFGQTYEVEIPEDDTMLLWDKPLSEQPKNIVDSLRKLSGPIVSEMLQPFELKSSTGESVYSALAQELGKEKVMTGGWIAKLTDDKAASEALASVGIRGIKYLDGTSRAKGSGSYNYVVFSGDDAQIQKTYYSRADKDTITVDGKEPSDDSILASRVTDDRIDAARRTAADKRQEASTSLGVTGPSLTWELDEGRFEEGIKGSFNRLREQLQDKYLSVLGAQGDIEAVTGKLIEESQNVYRRENLMHGRVAEFLRQLKDRRVNPIKRAMKDQGVSLEALEDFMEARAAPSRNRYIATINPEMPDGGSGMTTAEAKAFMAGKSEGLRSKESLTPEMRKKIEGIVSRIDGVRDENRTRLLESGQITQEQYDQIKANDSYAPLRDAKGNDIGVPQGYSGKGLDVRGKPIQQALGRGTGNRAENILANVFGDAEKSIIEAERTRVGQTLLRLVLANPNKDVWEAEPIIIERKFSEAKQLVYDAVKAVDNDPGAVRVMVKGKPYRIVLKDPRMAAAIKNLGAEQINAVFRFLGAINRYFSAILTRYNPSFVPINMIRDLGMGIVGITSEHGLRAGKDAVSSYLPAMRALWREARGKPSSGQTGVYVKEFTDAGGRTGFHSYQNVEEITNQIRGELKSMMQIIRDKDETALNKLARVYSKGATGLKENAIIQVIEDANDTIENSMRLAAFIARRKKGHSIESAAEYAKNVTVNFNRRGHATSVFNSMFLFFNAATQGSVRTFQLLKQKKVMGVMAGLASLQFVLAAMAMGDEDDDGLTAWEKIPDYEKERNLIFPVVGEENGKMKVKLFKLPMPYGFNFFPYMGGRLAQAMNSREPKDTWKLSNDLGAAAIDSVSPVKFTGGTRGYLPYLANIFVSLGYNKNDFGSRISDERPYSAYEVPRASLGRASTPEIYHKAAGALNRLGGGDEVTPPKIMANLLDWSPEDLKYLTEAFTGGIGRTINQSVDAGQKAYAGLDLSTSDIPVLKSIIADVNMERATQGTYYERKELIARESDRVRAIYSEKGKEAALEYMRETPALSGMSLHRFKTGKFENKDGRIQLEAKKNGLFSEYKKAEKEVSDISAELKAARTKEWPSLRDKLERIDELEKQREAAQRKLNVKWKESQDG